MQAPEQENTLRDPSELLAAISDADHDCADGRRLIVGVSGAPASGKSTLAQWLVEHLNADSGDAQCSIVVPMDGFHLDNELLSERKLLPVKGAPETFDATGFLHLIKRLTEPLNTRPSHQIIDASQPIYIPVFDRAMDLARCAAAAVNEQHRIIIVEGNYLLLDRPVWRDVSAQLDISVMLEVSLPILEQRLIKRWIDFGLQKQAARARALSNDIPNARVVIGESICPDLVLRSEMAL